MTTGMTPMPMDPGITVNDDGCSADSLAYCGGVQVSVPAGQDWPDFVALAVDRHWVGICLLYTSRCV